MLVLRRPVPWKKALVLMPDAPAVGQRLRLLRLVRVLGARVDLQLAELLHAQAVARQHALHGAADDFLGPAREQVAERLLAEAARVAAVARVDLGGQLVAGRP